MSQTHPTRKSSPMKIGTPPTIVSGSAQRPSGEGDGRQRNRRRDQTCGPSVHLQVPGQRRERERVVAGDPAERARCDVQDPGVTGSWFVSRS